MTAQARVSCDSCELLRINGVVCHETGCRNAGRTWDVERAQWVRSVECRECGCELEAGEACDCQTWEPEPWEPEPQPGDVVEYRTFFLERLAGGEWEAAEIGVTGSLEDVQAAVDRECEKLPIFDLGRRMITDYGQGGGVV
jgi:hypothetical protein